MPLNKLQNFIKNTDGRILYVSPNDLDATDAITNDGTSLAQPFKTIQRALIEAARFSYIKGFNNDLVEKTTILLFPGEHVIDNRPGYGIYNNSGVAYAVPPSGGVGTPAQGVLSLDLNSNFDLTQSDNILYKFNSVNGGVVVPRGTSVVGLDLRKTKLRPKFVPNPTDPLIRKSALFRITGACYFWQFSIFDGDETGFVYTHPYFFDSSNQSTPLFSHHKLTCFEYADGVNEVGTTGLTDLDMYYSKLTNAYNAYRAIPNEAKYPNSSIDFAPKNPEWEIVGAFASDPVEISSIISGDGSTASNVVTVTTKTDHNLNEGSPIKIRGVDVETYNVSTKVAQVLTPSKFTFLFTSFPPDLDATPSASSATVTVETDTVSGASPYIFNCSLRSVWGMNGMHADGSKASGFKSMVVAQFTAVSLQKDDRAFVVYDPESRTYNGVEYGTVTGTKLSTEAYQTNTSKVYHLNPNAIYRQGWESSHIKISNDAFVQIVSVFAIGFNKHFDLESGGDASITNSNSNFGQISLNSDGFRAEAFDKDDNAFVTSIIPPRDVEPVEEKIEWLSLDVGITTSVGISTHLYLYGLSAKDSLPVSLTQGYRVGARVNDKLYISIDDIEYSANIYMQDGVTSSFKSYDVINVDNSTSILTLDRNHTLFDGEKIIINSEAGDLPENIQPHIIYYVIKSGFVGAGLNKIKLASSYTSALNGEAIKIYGGTQLKIYSRVSDKNAGDIGSPIQYDETNKNWYITVNSGNTIYSQLVTLSNNGGLAERGLTETTDLTYVKRIIDERSLDERLYKVRVVIPKESRSARDPQTGFTIQESKSTGYRDEFDFARPSLTSQDYDFNRNPRFIATCTCDTLLKIITITSELPHGLNVGDVVIVRNITDSSNPNGEYGKGYNGRFEITELGNGSGQYLDNMFRYSTTDVNGFVHTPGSVSTNDTNDIANRTVYSPRFERNDIQSNVYVYRSELISPYVEGASGKDGIYHLYLLNASNGIEEEFTNLKYSQSPVNLYPQLDRDNVDPNPPAAKTYALRSPIGDTNTSDLKKSITRETVDKFVTSFNLGLKISTVHNNTSFTFEKEHGFGNITAGELDSGAGYNPTVGVQTYFNVKLFNNSANTVWKGATAQVTVNGGAVISSEIMATGSQYVDGNQLYFESARIGTGDGNARFKITSPGISTNIGDVVQITGIGTTSDGYYRITGVTNTKRISIGRTTGDPEVLEGQYAFLVGPSSKITSAAYNNETGITTFKSSTPHGLLAGNKFKVRDDSNNDLGDYVVEEKVGVTTFTAITNKNLSSSAVNGYILKHGLSANRGESQTGNENYGVRQVSFYAGECLKLSNLLTSESTATTVIFDWITTGVGTDVRFPLGSYIQIDNEIMRIISKNNVTQFQVLRGVLGTRKEEHAEGSLIRKIDPLSIEFHRPSILRASGHTFEYLGYGPGNYSTSLPQIQIKSLSEREDFLVQSQERSGGTVVYTGMNNNGDVFSGNTKTSSVSGELVSYDIPTPTVTGQDPSKSSVVYDEVTIKERLLVEGGDSGTVLSQFDGPVTFNQQTRFKNTVTSSGLVRIINSTESDSLIKGALTIKGGVGIGKNLNVGGAFNLTGEFNTQGNIRITNGAPILYLKENDVTNTPEWSWVADGSNFSGRLNNTAPYFLNVFTNGSNNAIEKLALTDTGTYPVLMGTATATGNGQLQVSGNTYISGNLGIGFDTPTSKLHVNGNVDIQNGFLLVDDQGINLNTTGAGQGDIRSSGGSDSIFGIYNSSTSGTIRLITKNSGGTEVTSLDITSGITTVKGSFNIEEGSIVTRIVSGDIQIYNNSVFKITNYKSSGTIKLITADSGGNPKDSLTLTSSAATIDAELRVTGDIIAFYSPSDKRWKDNVNPIADALNKVTSISGNTFDWNENSSQSGKDVGVIAQEIQQILPEAVVQRDDGHLSVSYQKLVPLLIEAIKELSFKVDELQHKINNK